MEYDLYLHALVSIRTKELISTDHSSLRHVLSRLNRNGADENRKALFSVKFSGLVAHEQLQKNKHSHN